MQKFIGFLKYVYVFIYIYIHKSFYTTLDKSWERTSKKWRDGEIGEHKLNEIALNMK